MRFRWRWGKVALGLVAYWLTSTVGAGLMVRAGQAKSMAEGWIILCMLVFASVCMATERGEWSVWKRVGFVPLVWMLHALLTPISFGIGILLVQGGSPELAGRAITFFASIPVVLWAMWRSWLFVERQSAAS